MNKEINKILIAGTEYDIRDSRFDEASQAETARQEGEQGRVTAEQARADAEAARAEEFATFEGKIAAKEDVANKVTSIGADANNTTFPTTRAVLNSIAEVKNIEVTPEMLSESTKQYINASGGGTITNLADDEDLTSVDNVLKLADKEYSPTSYSGMGRVYLRKNMVDGKNILTQEMLPSANTIYIIQYDYDLNGATINMPANCTLDFQGGSLRNGTIVLNKNVAIEAPIVEIFNEISIRVADSICIDKIHPDWFSGSDQKKIQSCIDIIKANGNMWMPTIFLSRLYEVTDEFDCTYLFDTAGPHPRVSLHIEGINPNRSEIHIKAGGNINNKPLFNCTGLNYGTFKNFSVSCESGLSPYCAFLLLRNSTNTNAGCNKFENIICLPYRFQYHYLIIGSENNSFINCSRATVYLDSYVPNNDIISDYYIRYDESYGGCTRNSFYRCDFESIYLGSSVTNTTFVGCYTNGGIRCVKSNSMVTFIDHRDETPNSVVPSFIIEENVTISNYYFDGKLNGVLGKDGSILKNCVISDSSNLKSGVSTEINGEIPSSCSFYLYDSYSGKYGAVGGSVIIRNKSLANESTNLITSTAIFENDDSDIKHLYLNNNNAVRHINYPQKAELYDFNHLLKCGALSYDFESINITQDGKISLDPLSPSVKVITLSANVTGLIVPNSRYNKGAYYKLIFVQDSVGNHSANINVAYIRGFVPHVNTEPNSITIVEIMELNGSFYYTGSSNIIKGSSAAQPANVDAGFQYFDTTLNKPIWWTGSAWVDATGQEV